MAASRKINNFLSSTSRIGRRMSGSVSSRSTRSKASSRSTKSRSKDAASSKPFTPKATAEMEPELSTGGKIPNFVNVDPEDLALGVEEARNPANELSGTTEDPDEDKRVDIAYAKASEPTADPKDEECAEISATVPKILHTTLKAKAKTVSCTVTSRLASIPLTRSGSSASRRTPKISTIESSDTITTECIGRTRSIGSTSDVIEAESIGQTPSSVFYPTSAISKKSHKPHESKMRVQFESMTKTLGPVTDDPSIDRSSVSSESSVVSHSKRFKPILSSVSKSELPVEDSQSLGGPKYYVVANTETGEAHIYHEAMPMPGDDSGEILPEEKGYEVIEYALVEEEKVDVQPSLFNTMMKWLCVDDDDRSYYSNSSSIETAMMHINDEPFNTKSACGLDDGMHDVLLAVGGFVYQYVGEPTDEEKRRVIRRAITEAEESARVWRDLAEGNY